MADDPKPQAKVNMEPNFEKRLRDIQDHAQKEFEARPKGDQVKWFRPENFNGDLTDYQLLGEGFERKQANQEAVDAVKDPNSPGVSGDTVAAVTMIETLAVMERSWRARHTMRRTRAVAHLAGRKKGHGDQTGPILQGNTEYLRRLLAQARKPAT